MAPERHSEFYQDGFKAPSPDEIQEVRQRDGAIHSWAGVTIVQLSPELIVKFGDHVKIREAKSMIFVAENTQNVPVPKVFGYYAFGPHPRDPDDYGSLDDTYIFMGFARGETLQKSWDKYSKDDKARISSQLRSYLDEIRSIPGASWIGSADHGELNDLLLDQRSDNKGPFETEQDFNRALIEAYQRAGPKFHIRSFLAGMLSERKHRIIFTHGDFRPANIIAEDGIITGIIDWEASGWYPEYWEFVRAFFTWRWQNDWTDHMLTILPPHYAEYGAYEMLASLIII